MINVSLIHRFNTVTKNITVAHVANAIKRGETKRLNLKKNIEDIRQFKADGKKENADRIKMGLPAVTFQGTFDATRKADNIAQYNHCVILDFDHIEDIDKVKQIISECQNTHLAFTSPSGDGLKVLVKVDSELEYHLQAFQQVVNFYEELTGAEIDQSGKDVARLTFLSYDPELYYNPDSEIFTVDTSIELEPKSVKGKVQIENPIGLAQDADFEAIVQFTQQHTPYEEGNRNNHLHLLANNCNRQGIEQSEALELIEAKYDEHENPSEIVITVNSAYKNEEEFGSNNKESAGLAELALMPKHFWSNTPTLPDDIFQSLPKLLKDGTDLFDIKRERDVFFLGALVGLSGCLPNVSGVYDANTVYPNLYLFITAPPASGKGTLNHSKSIIDRIHKEKQEQFVLEMNKYKSNVKACEADENCNSTYVEPELDLLIVPADASSSAMIKALKDNNENIIIIETEADTLVNTLKKDWAGYDDMLRKAFQHEKISNLRKTDNEHNEVENPKIAVIISGTPNQLKRLINDAENGLFSRFLYYGFVTDRVWKNPFANASNKIPETIERISKSALDFYKFSLENPFELSFNAEQAQIHFETFGPLFEGELDNEYESGVIARMGLICFRICMVLTAIRRYENVDLSNKLVCDDIDFMIAIELCKTLYQHSKQGLTFISKGKAISKEERFFKMLPENFRRSEANIIGSQLGIKERTVYDRLKQLQIEGQIASVKKGQYEKVNGKSAIPAVSA